MHSPFDLFHKKTEKNKVPESLLQCISCPCKNGCMNACGCIIHYFTNIAMVLQKCKAKILKIQSTRATNFVLVSICRSFHFRGATNIFLLRPIV